MIQAFFEITSVVELGFPSGGVAPRGFLCDRNFVLDLSVLTLGFLAPPRGRSNIGCQTDRV